MNECEEETVEMGLFLPVAPRSFWVLVIFGESRPSETETNGAKSNQI